MGRRLNITFRQSVAGSVDQKILSAAFAEASFFGNSIREFMANLH